jgi:hypothetical protein
MFLEWRLATDPTVNGFSGWVVYDGDATGLSILNWNGSYGRRYWWSSRLYNRYWSSSTYYIDSDWSKYQGNLNLKEKEVDVVLVVSFYFPFFFPLNPYYYPNTL